MTTTSTQSTKFELINRNLISLVAVIFLFYGGLGCLYGTLVPHIIELGFDESEIRTIVTTVALISVIGPLVVGPLTDKLADRRRSAFGSYLRGIIAVLLVFGAIAYLCLLFVPRVKRSATIPEPPPVSFGCDSNGALVFQKRCDDEKTCSHWSEKKFGQLVLTNCTYTCQNPSEFENMYNLWSRDTPVQKIAPESSREHTEEYDYEESEANAGRTRRELKDVHVEPPHLCLKSIDSSGKEVIEKCHVYNEPEVTSLKIDAALRGAINQENETHSAQWCNYPLGEDIRSTAKRNVL